ncbi:MAG: hypothetical protein AAFQ54_08405 [Pseudomonadota bacterium]
MSSLPPPPQLAALLARAAAAGVPTVRQAPCAHPDDGARFFAETVRGTILPRTLSFFCDGLLRVRANAKGGALLSVGEAAAGASMRPLRPEDLESLSGLLRRAFGEGGVVSVTAAPTSIRPSTSQVGIPGDVLLAAFGQAQPPLAVADRLSVLIEAARDVTLAILRGDGGEEILDASFESVHQARGVVAELFEAFSAPDFPMDAEHLLAIYPDTLPDFVACFHRNDADLTALVIHRDATEEVMEFWASLAG